MVATIKAPHHMFPVHCGPLSHHPLQMRQGSNAVSCLLPHLQLPLLTQLSALPPPPATFCVTIPTPPPPPPAPAYLRHRPAASSSLFRRPHRLLHHSCSSPPCTSTSAAAAAAEGYQPLPPADHGSNPRPPASAPPPPPPPSSSETMNNPSCTNPSTLSASQDLDLNDEPLPPSSNLDDSLVGRKQATVSSLTHCGTPTAFRLVLSEGEGGGFKWVVGEAQGRRKNMEDAHAVKLDIDGRGTALFGVFDGHGGREVAAFCAQHIVEEVVRSPAFSRGDLEGALEGAFLELDHRMREIDSRGELEGYAEGRHGSTMEYGVRDEHGRYQGPRAGSTAAVALIHGNELVVAHAGDSRVVLSDAGVPLSLTEDHKPDLPRERERIRRAGQVVLTRPGGVPRVGGRLAMSRAMGDVRYKDPSLAPDQQAVTAAPDITTVHLVGAGQQHQTEGQGPGERAGASELYPAGAGDMEGGAAEARGVPPAQLLVVACDGLWDVMNRQMVVDILEQHLPSGGSLRTAVSALLHEALRHDSGTPPTFDNVTALVVQLPSTRPPQMTEKTADIKSLQ